MIEVFGLDYFVQDRGETKQILKDISLTVQPGDRIALMGPNGSGKSTLLKRIAGILKSSMTQGSQIRFGGIVESELSNLDLAKEVVYLGPEFRADFPLTAFDAVAMGRYAYGDRFSSNTADRVHDAMERMGCWQHRFQMMNELSHGERQRVALARALVQDPNVLFLDEALSQIDIHHQFVLEDQLFSWMKKRSKALVIVSHDWNLAMRFADQVILLNQGQIAISGKSKEVVESSEMNRAFSGIGFQYSESDSRFPARIQAFKLS